MIEFKPSTLPNLITIARILLVVPTAWLLLEGRYAESLVLMAVAGASDALDGWLARRFGWLSRFGAALDPVADKLLVAVTFVVLTAEGKIPLWVAVIVLGRDAVILAGAGVYRLLYGPIEFSPTLISKANTAAQILMLILLLFGLGGFGGLSEWALAVVDPWCFYLLAVLGLGSGADYVFTWSQRAWQQGRKQAVHPAPGEALDGRDGPSASSRE